MEPNIELRPGETSGGLTILMTDDRHTASKVYSKNGQGFKKVRDYDLGFFFSAVPTDAENLEALAEIITELRQHHSAVIVRGGLDDAYYHRKQENPGYRITRRKNDKQDGFAPHLIEVPRNWGMIDIDGYPLPPDADLINNPEGAVEQAIHDLLPAEFHDAKCFWQLSSSCGLVEGILKTHLFFWFDRAHTNQHLRRWMRWHAPHVDIAPFSANQPHFIADAKIDGGDDPLPTRTGFIHKLRSTVDIADEVADEAKPAKRQRTTAAGRSVEGLFARTMTEALSHLGDGDGKDGFHRPLLAAGMAYARLCAKGRDRDDVGVKAEMRQAIKEAPKRADRGEGGVQNYLSDSYLDSQINGAFQLIANENSDAPKMANMPRNYGWTKAGLWYCNPKAAEDGSLPDPVWVSAVFHVVGVCENGAGGDWGVVLKWTDKRDHPHTWIIGDDAIHDAPKEIAKALARNGLKCNTATHPQLRNFIARLMPERQLTTVTGGGWYDGSFVLADGTVIGANDIIMRPDVVQNTDSCGVAGTLAEWQQAIGRYCVGNSRLALFTSAAFAGYLLDIVAEPSGGFHLHGESQSGKSTAGFCAGSVAGKGARGYNVHQWATTANGLEAKAAQNSDGCLVLDEIGQGQAGDAGNQIYRLCNESGKMRMTKEVTARKTEKWRIVVLSTGEITLQQRMQEAGKQSMTGTEVRLTNILADAEAGFGVFDTLHEFENGGALADHLRDAAKTYYGTPARAFLDALVEMRRDAPDGLYEHMKQARQKFMDANLPPHADGQVRSVAGRFGVVACAGELAIAANVLNWPAGEATRAAQRCFTDWLRARGTIGSGEQQSAIRTVQHFLELHGSSRFQEIRTGNLDMMALHRLHQWKTDSDAEAPDEALDGFRINNQAGYRQNDKHSKRVVYMITQEVWRNEVCRGMNPDLVAKALDKGGWLIREGKHLAKLKRLPDQAKRIRLYHVTSDILAADETDE